MLAMVLREIGGPLVPGERPDPIPGPGEVRIRVEACAVCRTDLHVIDGELPQAVYPIVPGHEVVGIVEAVGECVTDPAPGRRVGMPWLGHARGHCRYCQTERENLLIQHPCLYLVTRSLDPTGTGRARWITRWKPALNAFAITFADRFPAAETY